VRAEIDTESAVDADQRLALGFIPEDGSDQTGFPAFTAPCAQVLIENHSPTRPGLESIGGADFSARGVRTGPADHHHKPSFHSPDRAHLYAGRLQPHHIDPSGAGEHAELTANAPFRIRNSEPGHFFHFIILKEPCKFINSFGTEKF